LKDMKEEKRERRWAGIEGKGLWEEGGDAKGEIAEGSDLDIL
jgi:hypothetical protein